ncbi:MAG: peptide chain release factor-like protein [Planctomycetota bacterium]
MSPLFQSVPSPHPTLLPVEQLMQRLDQRFQKRGGPGGQHRNKVSTAAILVDGETGLVAEANESRSQRSNRSIACQRMRNQMATRLRTPSPLSQETPRLDPLEWAARDRLKKLRFKISQRNHDFAIAVACILNDFVAAEGSIAEVAEFWRVSNNRLLEPLRQHRPALEILQEYRQQNGLHPLR